MIGFKNVEYRNDKNAETRAWRGRININGHRFWLPGLFEDPYTPEMVINMIKMEMKLSSPT